MRGGFVSDRIVVGRVHSHDSRRVLGPSPVAGPSSAENIEVESPEQQEMMLSDYEEEEGDDSEGTDGGVLMGDPETACCLQKAPEDPLLVAAETGTDAKDVGAEASLLKEKYKKKVRAFHWLPIWIFFFFTFFFMWYQNCFI